MQRLKRMRALLAILSTVPLLSMQMTAAHAGVVSAEQYMSLTDRRVSIDSVTAALAREDVRRALRSHGVDPADAVERIAALNDQELMLLAENLEELPAGSGLLGTLGVVAIVVLILELLGVIDIFNKI